MLFRDFSHPTWGYIIVYILAHFFSSLNSVRNTVEPYSPFSVACEKVKVMAVKRSGRNFILKVGRVPLCQGCVEVEFRSF